MKTKLIILAFLILHSCKPEPETKQIMIYNQEVGGSTILTDYQQGLEILSKEYPEAADRLYKIMDSLHQSP